MSNLQNHRPSGIIKADISKLNPEARLAYGRHMAAQKRYNILSEICIGQLTIPRGGEQLDNFVNQASPAMGWVQSDHGFELASSAQLVTVLESSEPFAEAQEKLVPLLTELEASKKAEAEHATKIGLATEKVRQAEKAAQERALAKSASDPELTKARKALQEIE